MIPAIAAGATIPAVSTIDPMTVTATTEITTAVTGENEESGGIDATGTGARTGAQTNGAIGHSPGRSLAAEVAAMYATHRSYCPMVGQFIRTDQGDRLSQPHHRL